MFPLHAHGPLWAVRASLIVPPVGLFVAVSTTGSGDRVMTSPDGINWTTRTPAAENSWSDVTFGNSLLVAVGTSGTDRVMTSPNGVTWTSRTAPSAAWVAVAWSGSIFAAVSATGEVMSSPDGINWTSRTAASAQSWSAITWSPVLGLFAAVASGGTAGQRVMTSPDGINWTQRSSMAAPDGPWREISWSASLGLFVAVAQGSTTGGGHQVMTSPDGINWTSRTSADGAQWWTGVEWAPELNLFAAVGVSGTNTDGGVGVFANRVMTSPDGITWTLRADGGARTWRSVRWNGALFAAVANTGTGDRVMTSPDGITWTPRTTNNNNWVGLCWAPGLV